MPPIVNKRLQLVISNIQSISAEVRNKSLLQLAEFPDTVLSPAEKATFFQEALRDQEDMVKQTAKRLLNSLERKPLKVSISSTHPPQSPISKPVPPQESETVSTPSMDARHPPQPDPEPISAPVPEPHPPEENQPGAQTTSGFCIEAPPLEEEEDPSLPPLASLKAIPKKLEHIRFLARNRPGGHLAHLLHLAQDQLEEVSLTALQTLLTLKDPRIPPQILVFFTNPNISSQRRFLCLKIVMETSSQLEIAALEQILISEKDVIVKSGLVKVYARLAKEEGVATLHLCLFDPDPRVRANTVEVIEEQNITGCEFEIVKLLQDPENRVKVNAAKYLVKVGHPQAFQTLKLMLGSSEVWLRDSVIFALGEIGDQPSLTLLKAALKDPNQGIRLSVLKSMAKINNTPARESIQASVDDHDLVVAQVARGLWEKIKDLPPRPPPPPRPTIAWDSPPPPHAPVAPHSLKPAPTPVPQRPVPPPQAPPPPPVTRTFPMVPPAKAAPPDSMVLPSLESPTEHDESPIPAPPVKPVPPVSPPSVSPTPPGNEMSLPSLESDTPTPPKAAPQLPKPQPLPPPRPVPPIPAHPPVIPSRTAPPTISPEPSAPPIKPPAPMGTLPSTPPSAAVMPVLPPGSPRFQKPRAAETFLKLTSNTPAGIESALKDLPFIMGDDQMVLLQIAAEHPDDNVRLNAAKVLSRKKGPPVISLLQALANDPSPLVNSFAAKALTMIK